jgi:hypothetical protein
MGRYYHFNLLIRGISGNFAVISQKIDKAEPLTISSSPEFNGNIQVIARLLTRGLNIRRPYFTIA